MSKSPSSSGKEDQERADATADDRIAMLRDALDAAREEADRYRDLATANSDWFWEMGPDLRFSYVSSGLKRTLGIDPSMLIGKSRESIADLSSQSDLINEHLITLEQHKPFRNFVYRFIAGDGTDRFVSISGTPLFNDVGDFLGYKGTGLDLTDKIQADAETEAWKRKLSTTLETLSTGVALWDSEHRLVICNAAFRTMLGPNAGIAVPGASFRTIIRANIEAGQLLPDTDDIEGYIDGRLAARSGDSTEIELQLSGSRWVLVSERRTPDGLRVATYTDISDIRKREDDLRDLLDRNRQLLAAISATSSGVVILDATRTPPAIVFANQAFQAITGYDDRDVALQGIEILFGPETKQHSVDRVIEALTDSDSLSLDMRTHRKSGDAFWAQINISPVRADNGETTAFAVLVDDVSERVDARRQLEESEQRYALAVAGANDGIWDWNMRTGRVYFSDRWKQMLGYADDDLKSDLDGWLGLVHKEDVEDVRNAIERHTLGATPHFSSEHRILHKDGTFRWVSARGLIVRDADNEPVRMAGSFTEITDRKTFENQLFHDAFHDNLTDLPNRALFTDRLNHAINRSRRKSAEPFAVLFLDFDRFKIINDTLGHQVGDRMLMEISRRLNKCLRPSDTIARFGGDEFAVLIEDLHDKKEVIMVTERIIESMRRPFLLEGHEIVSSASIGIAIGEGDYTHTEDVLRDADIAMYEAKRGGKDRFVVFNSAMGATVVRALQIENDLRRAIERDELRLVYQPIVDLSTGHIASFEALLRWRHPVQGEISPAEFVPVAEDSGLIQDIGLWVLEAACRQTVDWMEAYPDVPPIAMSVNVAPRQLGQPSLVGNVRRVLEETGVPPELLRLEITESAIMENRMLITERLEELKRLGVQLYVDDFGTGYSSLGHLQNFPIDALKIDRTFVFRMGQNGENSEIVRSVTALANSLNFKVVAEGIEHRHHLRILCSLHCQYGQGYLFSAPVEKEAAEKHFRDRESYFEPSSFAAQ
jgi:diguanylate cyclase (GGDEF)-like protein/PAS domain S-box-containing protein